MYAINILASMKLVFVEKFCKKQNGSEIKTYKSVLNDVNVVILAKMLL